MTENELLQKMVAPGTRRVGKYRQGVIQIIVTSSCDKACFACTQSSQLARPKWSMPPDLFEQAVRSLGFDRTIDVTTMADAGVKRWKPIPGVGAYFGVVGLFGGNPALSPHFDEYCAILRRLVPFNQRGIWCNNPITDARAAEMRRTFDPAVSNLNVHLDRHAWATFKRGWPECNPVGLNQDSRHSPVLVAMKDVVRRDCPECGIEEDIPTCSRCEGAGTIPDDDRIRELISTCDINQHWSAMIGMFRGQLRAWFCEVAGAQAMLHQDEEDYSDTGMELTGGRKWTKESAAWADEPWWKMPMEAFRHQVRKHCWDCGVPLRGYGSLSQNPNGVDQVSVTHAAKFLQKKPGRSVEVVTDLVQLGVGKITTTTHYLQNARR